MSPRLDWPVVPARVALIPGVLALSRDYASQVDPVAELRDAVASAVGWLGEVGPVAVAASEQGLVIADQFLTDLGLTRGQDRSVNALLVVANGSACRTIKAPGFFDPRAEDFDASLREALAGPDPTALGAIDRTLAAELEADVDALNVLGSSLTSEHRVRFDYDDDPYGVQYWVARWESPDG